MARIIFIVGNDGSGKTTYSTRMRDKMLARGVTATRIHYYRLLIRTALRTLVDRASGVSARKFEEKAESPSNASQKRVGHISGPRASLLVAFLYFYQIAMAIEMRLRGLLTRADYLIVDRSYIDDLVSILGSFRLATPRRLVLVSAWLFPNWRVIYVSAGPEVEFARIVDVDLSRAVHLGKSRRYEEIAGILEAANAPLRRVDSTRPFEDVEEESAEEWE